MYSGTMYAQEPDAESCPVLVAAGMLQLNQTDPDAAMAMFLEHLALPNRTCCDADGFAFPRKPAASERRTPHNRAQEPAKGH